MTAIAATATSATSASIAFAGIPAGADTVQVQYGIRDDFSWSLAPILYLAPAAAQAITGLNQAGTYFFRARAVDATRTAIEPWSNISAIYTPVAALRSLAPAAIMIEPSLIVPPSTILNWWASSEEASYPARALGRDDPNSVWQGRQVNGIVTLEMQSTGEPIDTFALLASTAAENATIKVSAGASRNAALTTPVYTTGVLPFRASAGLPMRNGYHSLVRMPAPVAAPFWRIEIGGDTPGGLLAATYAVLGKAIVSAKNYSVDSKGETLVDRGTIDRDRSGNPDRAYGMRGRTVEFEINQLREADYEAEIERLRWRIGTTQPALVVPNSKAGSFLHDRILYGQMGATRATNNSSPRFSVPFRIDSLI
jgi:hypothetical protein